MIDGAASKSGAPPDGPDGAGEGVVQLIGPVFGDGGAPYFSLPLARGV
jgi:hypothetical protein